MANPIVKVGDHITVTYIKDPWWAHKYLNCRGIITEIHEDGKISGTWGENYLINPEEDSFEISSPVEE